MNDATSLKVSELLLRTSIISKDIIAEEENYNKALLNNSGTDELEAIKNKISLLKRKQALFNQAAEICKSKGQSIERR